MKTLSTIKQVYFQGNKKSLSTLTDTLSNLWKLLYWKLWQLWQLSGWKLCQLSHSKTLSTFTHILLGYLFFLTSAHFELSTELSTYPQKKVVFCQYSIFCQKLSTYPHFTPFIFLFLLLLFLCLLACFFTYYLKPFFCPLLAFCYLAW